MSEEILVEPYVPSGIHLPHYAKVRQLGDTYLTDLMLSGVVVEEKVDGSQFRFMKLDGRVICGSHRVNFDDANPPDKLFRKAADYVESIGHLMPEGIVFFAEFLAKSHHNTIVYEHPPKNGLMLFDAHNVSDHDIEVGELCSTIPADGWADLETVGYFSAAFDIDPPAVLFEGMLDYPSLQKLLSHMSYLGNSTIEGVVVKNYTLTGHDPHHPGNFPMMGKLVRKSFKEENDSNWKAGKDILSQVILRYRTDARWEKARIHARDDGKTEGSMRDMKVLIDELDRDLDEECKEAIKEMLWQHYESSIRRGLRSGMAEWLKEQLTKQAFQSSQVETPIDDPAKDDT
jgi:hypothetical protein